MHLDVIKLSRIINQLEELFRKILTGLIEDEFNTQALGDYLRLKKELLIYLFDKPIQITDSKNFAGVRERLQRLTLNGDPFLPDNLNQKKIENNEGFDFTKIFEPEFTFNEVEELASSKFYSWFSGEEYVINKMKSQILFLQTERLPENFQSFIREIQECYVFQNYIAAFVLCRTVTDIAIRDLFDRNKLQSDHSKYWDDIKGYYEKKRENNNHFTIEDFVPNLFERMNIMGLVPKFSLYKNEMHEVRSMGNSIIHGNSVPNHETCTEMIKKTFFLIHHLYEVN